MNEVATRIAPQRTLDKWEAWKHWSSVWNWTHILTGGAAVGSATIVAVNAKADFLTNYWKWVVPALAARHQTITRVPNIRYVESVGNV